MVRGFLLFLPLLACACATASVPETAPTPLPTPAEIAAARQAAFNLTAATFGGMKPTIESGGEVKGLALGARGLSRWGRALPAMFPDGSDLPADRAKAEIWEDKADFDAKAAAMAEAATRLADAAAAGDKAAVATHYAALGQTCAACHDRYRTEAPR